MKFHFQVNNTDGLNLSNFHDSLHFFFEEHFYLDQTGKFNDFRNKIIYISTSKTEQIIEVIVEPETITVDKIIQELKQIGILTQQSPQ